MIMVIDPGSNVNSHSTSAGKARQQNATKSDEQGLASPSTKQQPAESDSVSLSSASLSIAKIESKIAQTSDIDTAKVDRIKTSVDSGNYQIDSGAIANTLLQEEQQLG